MTFDIPAPAADTATLLRELEASAANPVSKAIRAAMIQAARELEDWRKIAQNGVAMLDEVLGVVEPRIRKPARATRCSGRCHDVETLACRHGGVSLADGRRGDLAEAPELPPERAALPNRPRVEVHVIVAHGGGTVAGAHQVVEPRQLGMRGTTRIRGPDGGHRRPLAASGPQLDTGRRRSMAHTPR